MGDLRVGDLLVQGVRLIGPPEENDAQGDVSGPLDVLIRDGYIRDIHAHLAPPPAGQVLDGRGAWLSPGWIDLHTHVFQGVSGWGLDPDQVGFPQGVHLLVDAGSSGETTLPGFKRYVAERSRVAVRAFVNISSLGLIVRGRSELPDLSYADLERTVAAVEANRELVRGIKLRASARCTGHLGLEPLKLARRVAREAGLPLMVHIGEPPPSLPDILGCLDAGDVVTHCFHGKPGGILDHQGRVLPSVRAALERGILFDVGHGAASFSYRVAENALGQGIVPNTISTDLHAGSLEVVGDLATTMSKMLAVGMSLHQVVAAVTHHPARLLGEPDLCRLTVGAPARLTLFALNAGGITCPDGDGHRRGLSPWLQPLASISPQGVTHCTSPWARDNLREGGDS